MAFEWIKRGLVYSPGWYEDRQFWNYDFAQGQNALVFDDFVRVYFCTREKPKPDGTTFSRVSYVDLDRNNLQNILRVANRPVIELGELGTFDEFGTYPFCPIRIGKEIYGYYGGVTRCESVRSNVNIGIAVSKDNGENFERLGPGPVLSNSLHEPFNVCSPKVRRVDDNYYMFYSAGRVWTKTENSAEICYKLRLAISTDGVSWKKQNKDIIPDVLGELESQACGDVLYKNGKFHMFFCYRRHLDFRSNKENSYRIGYAVSDNCIDWIRRDELVGIKTSDDPDDFDYEMVAYPNLLELDGKVFMFYLGNGVGREGFALAELRGDLI